jgi:hypothetical protein
MIERVAQAILAKDPEGMFSVHYARVYARAAIAAMREPTEAMYKSDYNIEMAHSHNHGFPWEWSNDVPTKIWQLMIDAALECSAKPDGQ